jgi:hypothetical protein
MPPPDPVTVQPAYLKPVPDVPEKNIGQM